VTHWSAPKKLSFMAFVLSSQKLGCPYCNTFSSRRQQELHFAGTSVIIGGNITCYSPEEERKCLNNPLFAIFPSSPTSTTASPIPSLPDGKPGALFI
jgi:hypothetical protein